MSFVRDGDELLVLDQVNRRVVRYDAVGGVGASFEVSNTTQDIAVAKDGTVALLDRLVDKTVRLTDAKGHVIATLPLSSDRVPESGLVTGMFVDGKDIYVEKEHGVLVRVGSTDGRVGAPAELNGRPSKDGALLLMAALTAAEARVTLNAFDRKLGTLRFARTIAFARPALEVVLVDTDRRGTIYVGVSGGQPPSLHVACLDPGDGHVLGRVTLASSLAPEEAFREVTIADDGTIVSAYRTDEGVEYRTSRCPGM